MALRNEFLEGKVAKADFTVLASTGTQALTSGVFIPGSAIVTGVTVIDLDALGSVQTNDSATINIYVCNTQLSSSQLVCSAKSIGYFGTVSIPTNLPLSTTAGVYIAVPGEIVMSVQASSGTLARTFSPQVFLGYVSPIV